MFVSVEVLWGRNLNEQKKLFTPFPGGGCVVKVSRRVGWCPTRNMEILPKKKETICDIFIFEIAFLGGKWRQFAINQMWGDRHLYMQIKQKDTRLMVEVSLTNSFTIFTQEENSRSLLQCLYMGANIALKLHLPVSLWTPGYRS